MTKSPQRWLALLLLFAVVLSACDNSTPAANPTPTVSASSNQPSSSTTPTQQSDDSTPASQPSSASTPTTASSAVIGTPAVGTPRPTLVPPTPEPARPPSSIAKIEAAVAAGTLDSDTGLLYQLYDLYIPAKLPAAYHGDDTRLPEPTALFTQLRGRMDKLPAAAQAEVQPFFLRPDDPQSFWYQSAVSQTSGQVRGPGLASPSAPNFKYADSTHVRVWYDMNDASITRKATALAAEIDRSDMWGKEKKTMLGHEPCSDASLPGNGGDGRVDLYLVAGTTIVGRTNSQGKTITETVDENNGVDVPLGPANGCPNATFMLVNAALDSRNNRSTTAHELFHAFQFSFNWPYDTQYDKYGWWVESSATWAKDLVYPTDDFEQGYLYANWTTRPAEDGPLDLYKYDDNPQYATYLWSFYLRQAAGGDETVIGKLWKASETEIPLKVMSNIENWSHHFKEFALWNWNERPVEEYKDAGRLISNLGQNPGIGALSRPNHPSYTANIDLPQVSVRYYKITVSDYGPTDPETFVNQVRFDLTGLAGNSERGVQAIMTLGSNPLEPKGYLIEDWSNLAEKVICREVNPFSSVVLVVSNGAIDGSRLKGPIKAEALSQCPKEANYTYNIDTKYKLAKNDDYVQQSGSASTHESLSSSWDVAFLDRQATGSPEEDVTNYIFTATNTYQVDLSGSFQAKSKYDTTVNTNLTGGGTYVSHNPPLPDDDEYKYSSSQYQGKNGASMLNTWHGTIQTRKQEDGTYGFEISFIPTSVAVKYQYSKHMLSICPQIGSTTTDEKYDELHMYMSEQGTPGCVDRPGVTNKTLDKPYLFGKPQWERTDSTYRSATHGTYDPSVGILEGQESYSYDSCQQATELDPLNYFVGQVGIMGILEGPADDRGGCTISYQLHFRVELPPNNNNKK